MLGLFIDDQRDLTIPSSLQGETIDWHVFRNLNDLRRSPVFTEQPVDHVCFDYYLDDHGRITGSDAIYILTHYYKKHGWPLPKAAFHSSDDSKNVEMRDLWLAHGGECIEPTPETTPNIVLVNSGTRKTGVSAYFSKNKTKKRGGRP